MKKQITLTERYRRIYQFVTEVPDNIKDVDRWIMMALEERDCATGEALDDELCTESDCVEWSYAVDPAPEDAEVQLDLREYAAHPKTA